MAGRTKCKCYSTFRGQVVHENGWLQVLTAVTRLLFPHLAITTLFGIAVPP